MGNIIPIIAKADTINKAELAKFKSKIMNELKSNGVSIYQFPLDDETVAEANKENNQHLPFAVVGSNEFVKVGSKEGEAQADGLRGGGQGGQGKQFCGDLHNAERVSFAVASRKGRGDETKVCPQG